MKYTIAEILSVALAVIAGYVTDFLIWISKLFSKKEQQDSGRQWYE